jgi:MFS family permease
MANRWVALVIVFVTRTSMGFQFQSVAAVAPLMVAELQLTWVQLGSLIGLYLLPGAVFALPGGVLGQRFGDRRIVVVSLALMVAGGLVTAAAHGFIVAAAGRLLSGVGAVLMNILLAKMVADWFAERELSTAMGIMLTSWPVGLGIAAATLGALATRTRRGGRRSWRRRSSPRSGSC